MVLRFGCWLVCCLVAVEFASGQCVRKCHNLFDGEAWRLPQAVGALNNPSCYNYDDVYGEDMWSDFPYGGKPVSPTNMQEISQYRYTDCSFVCASPPGGPQIMTVGDTHTFYDVLQIYCSLQTSNGTYTILPGGP